MRTAIPHTELPEDDALVEERILREADPGNDAPTPARSGLGDKIHRNWRTLFFATALLTDMLTILLSSQAAIVLRQFLPGTPRVETDVLFNFSIYFGAVIIVVAMISGVYRAAYHSHIRAQYMLAGRAYWKSILIIFASLYIIQQDNFPRRFTILMLLLIPPIFVMIRSLLNRLNFKLQKKGLGVHNVLIVGYEDWAHEVFERFRWFPELGYNIRGFVSNGKKNGSPDPYYSLAEIDQVIRSERIDRIFIPSSRLIANGYARLLSVCQEKRIKLKVLSPESDWLLRMMRVYDIAGITLHSPERGFVDLLRRGVKRGFDIVVSLILIILCSPVYLLTAIAIMIESGKPVIFRQVRASSKNGRSFEFYKFRSMIKDADELKETLLKFNETDGALFKMKKDPRMTKVGKVIRKFSIDELPQLFNVLKGDMSIVGPRPLPIPDFEKVKEGSELLEAITLRDKVRPGITGLWQISGRSSLGFRDMVLLDLYYIENQSFIFDLEIMFETIPVVLFGKGAY